MPSRPAAAKALITRLPYALIYDPAPILEFANQVEERGLICVSIPLHMENPNNGGALIAQLEQAGMTLVSLVSWSRDRHIVAIRSRRLTNSWEPLAIFSRSKEAVLDPIAIERIDTGSDLASFDDEEYYTCSGDTWKVRNDTRDRRFLPRTIVINCGELARLKSGDQVLDPYGNPGIGEACEVSSWEYHDGGLPNEARGSGKRKIKKRDQDDTDEP